MGVFFVLQIGVALVQNIEGFLVLRFLSGVAASPPATLGAGTITDVVPFLEVFILLEGLEPWSRAGHRCGNFLDQPLCWTSPRTHCGRLRCRNHRLEMDNLDSHDIHDFRLDPAMVCARDLCALYSLQEGQRPRKGRRKCRPTQIPSVPNYPRNRSKTTTSYILPHISKSNH